jgi:hypothetical protein
LPRLSLASSPGVSTRAQPAANGERFAAGLK